MIAVRGGSATPVRISAHRPVAVGSLAVSEGIDVIVTVAIPAGAGDEEQDVATVTFTSRGAGRASASSVLTTTANVLTYRFHLPLVFKNY